MSMANEIRKQLDRLIGIPAVQLLRLGRHSRGRSAAAEQAAREPDRILFIKLWGVGNLAMILPLIRAARRRHPTARIEFLTLDRNTPFLAGCGVVDTVHTFAADGIFRPILELLRLGQTLRGRRFDLVVDFEQFLKCSALLSWMIDGGCSVGFRTPRQLRHGLHDVEVGYDDQRHMALVFGDLVRAVGIPTEGLPPLSVPRSEPARRRVALIERGWTLDRIPARTGARFTDVPPTGPLVALHVGSGDNFKGRRWPTASFARLADELWRRTGARIVFTGTAAEAELVFDCRSRMDAPSIDASDQFSLVELVEFLAGVDLLVSNDTAPVHLGSALGIALIALYGPNTPDLYGPLSPAARVFHHDPGCSPCITNSNAKTSFCRRPLCMTSIHPDEVLRAALELLDPVPLRGGQRPGMVEQAEQPATPRSDLRKGRS